MKNFDSLIFDLDGTLWDTGVACAVAWNNVLKKRQILFRQINPDDIRQVAGKPHEVCIRETFIGLPEPQLLILINNTMEEDNAMIAKLGGQIYEGVVETIKLLSENVPLFIVSNCQTGYIENFLKLSGLATCFKDFECWGNTGKPKSKNLASVIARNKLKKPIYIGDTEGDQIAARSCGIPFYFAKYGFGKVTDFDESFSSFQELKSLLGFKDILS